MKNKINIFEIGQFIENCPYDLVVIGQPKSIGTTTAMLDFFSNKIFWEETFNVLILVESQQSKANCAQYLREYFFEVFGIQKTFNFLENFFEIFGNKISILSYKNQDKIGGDEIIFDYGYVDKDEDNELLNLYLTEYLANICKKIVIATYDFPNSLYYSPFLIDEQKTLVTSQKYFKNLSDLNNLETFSFTYEKTIKGEFLDNEEKI